MKTIAISSAAALTVATPAFAAPTFADHSGLLVWTFLGFCAAIVVAQVLPAVMMMFGMAQGALVEQKESAL